MRRISINDLEPDMILARAIHNSDGRILLHANMLINESYIYRLQAAGILSVYVKDKYCNDLEIQDVVSEQTRIETVKVLKDNFNQLEKQHKMNIRMVRNMVDHIVDELLINKDILVNLTDIRSFDDYTFAHSVNVCVLSIMTGITLQYNSLKLMELGMGALLHDIGKTRIDRSILQKPDDLTREEWNEVKQHSEYGFDILRKYDDLSLLSAHVAFQHHERWDGHGYPRKLAGENIHEYARIVAVADVYDALLADRPYRPGYSVNQAILVLKRMAGIYLDANCINALLANISTYPIGCIIELSTGEIGIVVDVNKEMPARPVIRLIYNNLGKAFLQFHEVDLSKLSTIVITRTLSEKEFAYLTSNSE
ncbi:MAG: HD-GYP domain-containing protein [Syntrophomonadaceae bacterium]|nr:HD-GYP domain-containing protein [Syntrophomonadaceae bacterium]MDD3022588.1 HD-GYP domain-containing protein [Syntrophomonadaceae bacterium]